MAKVYFVSKLLSKNVPPVTYYSSQCRHDYRMDGFVVVVVAVFLLLCLSIVDVDFVLTTITSPSSCIRISSRIVVSTTAAASKMTGTTIIIFDRVKEQHTW